MGSGQSGENFRYFYSRRDGAVVCRGRSAYLLQELGREANVHGGSQPAGPWSLGFLVFRASEDILRFAAPRCLQPVNSTVALFCSSSRSASNSNLTVARTPSGSFSSHRHTRSSSGSNPVLSNASSKRAA